VKAKLLVILTFWFPWTIVAAMAGAAVGYAVIHQPRRAIFWVLDAAITFWSAFYLR
jgi:hypothetical protein